jgi:hypothetical protein
MVVNFRVHGISRGAHKLALTLTLIKKIFICIISKTLEVLLTPLLGLLFCFVLMQST